MKHLFLLLLIIVMPVYVHGTPLEVEPDPPASDPILPTETDPVYKNSTDFIAQSPEVKVVHHRDLNKKILIALIASSSLLVIILLLFACCSIYRWKRSKKNDQNSDKGVEKGISLNPKTQNTFSNALKVGNKKGSIASIDYRLLAAATNNFDDGNLIGEDELGRVYKARFDEQFHAAVKKISTARQDCEREFENEVDLLRRIQHQNIVPLLGYCVHNEDRFLVYQMMENGSLESHLYGPSRRSTLTWHTRMKIALDIARGLEYLHEWCNPPVIHRDLKSSNILLDSRFNAKLCDLSLAITTGANSSKAKAEISGTLGYVAPEYLLDGKLTDKSDVYAFGVILLELLTGRRPMEKAGEAKSQSIVSWAMPQLTDREKLPRIVDPFIRNTMDLKHLYQVAAIAVLCVQKEPSYRPLITDVLHSFIPLVPVDLGGSLRAVDSSSSSVSASCVYS